jgi:hypothetical protein
MNDFLKQYELYFRAVANANELNKPVVFDALAAACLTRVRVEFDGGGDSGQIDDITAYTGEVPVELPSTSPTLHQAAQNAGDPATAEATLRDAIETLCYDYLSQTHGGWGNEDGAYGTFEFDVPNRTIHLDFNERFTDSTNFTHDF